MTFVTLCGYCAITTVAGEVGQVEGTLSRKSTEDVEKPALRI